MNIVHINYNIISHRLSGLDITWALFVPLNICIKSDNCYHVFHKNKPGIGEAIPLKVLVLFLCTLLYNQFL